MGVAFVHLHTHSHYSLLDAVPAPEELVARAAALGMPALALTDHDALFGAARFYRAARAAGIHPIIGCELTVGPGGHHVVVLARDDTGYRHLCRLATLAASAAVGGRGTDGGGRAGGPGYPAAGVDREALWRWGDGLIVLSGCARGEIPSLLAAGRRDEARAVARAYRERFGPDGFFIELQDHGLPQQAALNRELVQLAADEGLEVVATHNVHYTVPEQAAARAALARLATGGRAAGGTAALPSDDGARHLASAQEMARRFAHWPAALRNTVRIAEQCQVELAQGGLRLPAFAPGGRSPDELLARLVEAGARRRYGQPLPGPAAARARHELAIIQRMGLASYFLLLWDAVRWARQQGIAIGPGRGSATSSLVAYCLGITDVDPLAHGLVFERFLNPDRQAPPDIDIDVCDYRRGELLEYIRRRHGPERVAQIATFATLAARAALREMGRVLGVAPEAVDRLVRLIPGEPGMTLAAAAAAVPALERARQDPEVAQLWQLAQAVEGVPSHLSVHAAGIVVGDGPLEDQLPLVHTGPDTRLIQYPMADVEALGYLKVDFLGLRTLTVIQRCRELIAARGGTVPDPLPLDDGAVYRMLSQEGTDGVFQLETPMFRRLTAELQPQAFSDLVALLALGRPGPAQRIDAFLRRRHGREPVRYLHPSLAPVLEETYGIILYQEQVMRIAMDLAGFSAAEADLLRRGMSKKQPQLLAEARERFLAGAKARGVPTAVAAAVFAELERFAGYGFAKSHSVAYARISYETAYLRRHFPAEFMAALLSSVRGNPDRVARYVAACRRLGVRVLPPHVNESDSDFTVTPDGAIRYGLGAVKHVGHGAAAAIVAARGQRPFRSLQDLVQRVPGRLMPRRVLQALIEAGALDGLGPGRREMLAAVDRLGAATGGTAPPPAQVSMFAAAGSAAAPPAAAAAAIGESGPVFDMLDGGSPALVVEITGEAAPHLQRLVQVLRRFPGDVPVIIRVWVQGAAVTVLAGNGVRVAPTDGLLAALADLAQEGWLKGAARLA
ncbi:MAG TPA: DNA polymerase III subunit alpha [Limnochordales bacterium]|nr:DNA polymerase III subunit alpha [Limnochordales bacterium]